MVIQLKEDGQTKGPFSVSEIRGMVDSGSLKPTALAREKGKIKWKPLQEVVSNLTTPALATPTNQADSWGRLLAWSQDIVAKLQPGIRKGDDCDGALIIKVGAGLFVAVMVLHLIAMIYFQGFLFWHGLCLLAQTTLAVPFFLKGKSNCFPFAMAVILIVYVLGNSDLLGIQITKEYWDADGATSRNARVATQSPRLQSLEREKRKLEDQRNLTETRMKLGLEAAGLKAQGKVERAQKAEEELYNLRSKLSKEDRDKLTDKINLINAKISRRKWKDRYDSQVLKKMEVTIALLYIGVFLAGFGAWSVRDE
jgi:hypothetical protein